MSPEPVKFFPDILEEFFEELDFLWMQRESVVFAPDWTLRDLADLEERAEAHLDGLRLSGEDGVALARPHLRGSEKGAATAAAFVFMEAARPELDAEVVSALEVTEAPVRVGIGIALRHVDVARIVPELRRLAAEADPLTRSIAVDVLGFHRLGPPPPKILELFVAGDPEIRARAYAAAGRFGGPWSPDELQSALDQPHPGLRWAAIHASARLGMPRLKDHLRRTAMRVEVPAPEAIEFLGAFGDPNDLQLFQGLMTRPALRNAAIAAMGASGRVAAVPPLLTALADPHTAAAASRAFTRITAATGLPASPAPATPPFADDEAAFQDPETPLDPAKSAAWWDREKGRFPPDGRWQWALDVGREPLGPAFDLLPLAFRRDVLLAYCASGGIGSRLEPEARVVRQLR